MFVLFQVQGDSPFAFFTFFSFDNPKGSFRIAYNKGCVRYDTYRGMPTVLPAPDTSVSTSIPVTDTLASSVRHHYHFGKFGRTSRSVLDTLVSSVRHQYRYRTFGEFGTTFIPVPDTSGSSVRHQYRHRTLRSFRYHINTGAGHFSKFGTTSIPVPDTSVSSVRHQYRYQKLH